MAAPAIDQSQMGMYMVVGATVGAAIGGWPASLARARGRYGLAIVSVVVCGVAGAIGGCLFAAPLAWVLTLIIKGMTPSDGWDSTSGLAYEDYEREHRRSGGSRRRTVESPDRRANDRRYTEIGHVLVCNDCRQSTSKGPGGVIPAECPNCGLRFVPRRDSGVSHRPAPRTARLVEDDLVNLEVVKDRGRR